MKLSNGAYIVFLIIIILVYIYFCKLILAENKKRTALIESDIAKENAMLKNTLESGYDNVNERVDNLVTDVSFLLTEQAKLSFNKSSIINKSKRQGEFTEPRKKKLEVNFKNKKYTKPKNK